MRTTRSCSRGRAKYCSCSATSYAETGRARSTKTPATATAWAWRDQPPALVAVTSQGRVPRAQRAAATHARRNQWREVIVLKEGGGRGFRVFFSLPKLGSTRCPLARLVFYSFDRRSAACYASGPVRCLDPRVKEERRDAEEGRRRRRRRTIDTRNFDDDAFFFLLDRLIGRRSSLCAEATLSLDQRCALLAAVTRRGSRASERACDSRCQTRESLTSERRENEQKDRERRNDLVNQRGVFVFLFLSLSTSKTSTPSPHSSLFL